MTVITSSYKFPKSLFKLIKHKLSNGYQITLHAVMLNDIVMYQCSKSLDGSFKSVVVSTDYEIICKEFNLL